MNRLYIQVKSVIIFISVLSLSLSQNLNSEYEKSQLYQMDTTDFNWYNIYPLNVGDYWVYECYSPNFFIGLRTKEVVKDTLINDVVFKKIRRKSEYDDSISFGYERVDTSSYIYKWIYDHQIRWLKLNVCNNDTFYSDSPWSINENDLCYWLIEDIWLDEFKRRNIFYYWDYLTATRYWFIENIGLKSGTYEGGGYVNLKGCYINGVLNGDTSTVSNSIENNNKICLADLSITVYPNPFNSSTIIKFTLDKKSRIKLYVYDIRGNLVKVLEDNSLNQGDYKYTFDATGLTSGIYFYKLNYDNQSVIKKMTYLK